MKVLQINSVVNSGSTGKIAEAIGKEIIEDNSTSTIAYGRSLGSENSASNLFKVGNRWSNALDLLLSRLFDNQGQNSSRPTRELVNFIVEEGFDLIHLHNVHGYFLNINILLGWVAEIQIPVVLTLHDCWAFTGHCAYFDRVGCDKWKTHCHTCPQIQSYPKSLLVDRSARNFALKRSLFGKLQNLTTVAVSHWLDEQVGESFLKHAKRRVIRNGVNLEVFRVISIERAAIVRRKYQLGISPIILGVANVWDERKGLADLIKLSARLNTPHKLVVVGLTRSQLRDLPDGVQGIARTENQEELATFYCLADVYVNPTYEDNFPTTNIESLACGTPVVTYRTGGSPEAIDEFTGTVVPQGDVGALVDVVSSYLGKKKNFSVQCRERAVNLFDEKAAFKEYVNLYKDLLHS